MKKEVSWGFRNGMLGRTDVVKEFANVRKNCLWLISSRETTKVAKRSKVSLKRGLRKTSIFGEERMRTFRYGLPRFVTFIMWEEVAWGIVSGMAGKAEGVYVKYGGCEEEKREEIGGRRGGEKRRRRMRTKSS
jgi:hypothetical protein